MPQYLPEEPTEAAVRRRVLDQAGLPYLLVRLDPAWRLASDRHPDPRGARAIAAAIVRALAMPSPCRSPEAMPCRPGPVA